MYVLYASTFQTVTWNMISTQYSELFLGTEDTPKVHIYYIYIIARKIRITYIHRGLRRIPALHVYRDSINVCIHTYIFNAKRGQCRSDSSAKCPAYSKRSQVAWLIIHQVMNIPLWRFVAKWRRTPKPPSKMHNAQVPTTLFLCTHIIHECLSFPEFSRVFQSFPRRSTGRQFDGKIRGIRAWYQFPYGMQAQRVRRFSAFKILSGCLGVGGVRFVTPFRYKKGYPTPTWWVESPTYTHGWQFWPEAE